MKREEYNRLYDVWFSAKPEHVATADWARIWEMSAGKTSIEIDWSNIRKRKQKSTEDLDTTAPWS